MTGIEPLYVDARANERTNAVLDWVVNDLANDFGLSEYDVQALRGAKDLPYVGQGTLLAPFLTFDEATAVRKPGQPIIVTGYGTLRPADNV
jgi:hypothetical protein